MSKIKYNDVQFVPSADCSCYEECREDAYQQGREDAIEEQKELMYALADHVLKSQFGYCLTCENHMKNITIDGVRNGCDGSCSHSKEWTVEEFIDLFEQELRLEKRLKGGAENGV